MIKTLPRNDIRRYMVKPPVRPQLKKVDWRDYIVTKKGKRKQKISEVDRIAYDL